MNSWCFHGKDVLKCSLCNGDGVVDDIMKKYEAARKAGRTQFLHARDDHRGHRGALEEHVIVLVLQKLHARGIAATYERNVRCQQASCATGHAGFVVQVTPIVGS